MAKRFIDRTEIGAIPNFSPLELVTCPEHGFTDADKRDLIRAFHEIRDDKVLSFGFEEYAIRAEAYDPLFNERRRIEIRSTVLKAILAPALQPLPVAPTIVAKPDERQVETLAGGEATDGRHSTDVEFVFRPDGDGYYLKGLGESGHVTAKGAKGLHDLFRLVQTPGVPVPMLELDAGPGVERAEGDGQSRQPVADGETLKQLAAKRKQLKADIASAGSDMERNELSAELTELEEIAKAMRGFNGKPRDLNNPLDRLRPKLLRRISTAVNKLREAKLDKLADHFGLAVSSESDCLVYRPAVEGLTWNVTKL